MEPNRFLRDEHTRTVVEVIDNDSRAAERTERLVVFYLHQGDDAEDIGLRITENISDAVGTGLPKTVLEAFLSAVPKTDLGSYYLARAGFEMDEEGRWSLPAGSGADQ